MTEFDYKALGSRILARRKKLGLTQEEISEMLNISRVYYSSIESGHRKIYTSTLVELANALETTADDLLLGQQEWDQKTSNYYLSRILQGCSAKERYIILQTVTALKDILTKNDNEKPSYS